MPNRFRLLDMMAVATLIALLLVLGVMTVSRPPINNQRLYCASRMRQVGLALIQYQQNHGVFPMSAVAGTGHGTGHSGLTMVLPYLESQEVYDAYNFQVENWHAANSIVVEARLSILQCPSDPTHQLVPAAQVQTIDGRFYPGSSNFAVGHYAVNWGGGRAGWASDFASAEGSYRGVMMTVTAQGPKGPTRCIRKADIADGTSTTILLTEKRDSQGWAVGGWAGSEFDPWTSPDYQGSDPWACKVYSGSNHGGGANVVFCDGSNRFLYSEVDRRVWYALLTRDGGEVIDPEELDK